MEKIANFTNDRAPFQERFLHVVVAHQIEIALAVSNFRVHDAVPFLRHRSQRFAQNNKARQLHRNFARLRREHRAIDADKIAEIEMRKNVPLLIAQNIFLRINLDSATLIFDVDKHALAHFPMRGDAPSERDFAAFDITGASLAAFFFWRKFIGKRVDAFGAKSRQFYFSLFDQ